MRFDSKIGTYFAIFELMSIKDDIKHKFFAMDFLLFKMMPQKN